MDLPDLDNQTEFEVEPHPLLTPAGEAVVLVIKATFELNSEKQELKLADKEKVRPIRSADEPWDEPEIDSIRYPSDLSVEKAGTDVIVVASAHAPGGIPVPSFDAYVRVGPIAKSLKIFGLRVWEARGAGISAPRPITELPIRYDYAYGGIAEDENGKVVEEPRNPVGRGVAAQAQALTHQEAPQIEDPNQLIKNYKTAPPPAGIGVRGRTFQGRREYSGTFDETWQEYRAPLPPKDQDARFYHSSSEGMHALPALQGGEECALLNLHSQAALQFKVPLIGLEVKFEMPGRPIETVYPSLATFLIDTSEATQAPIIEMTWLALSRAPRKMRTAMMTVREIKP